jgi:hypothetical protein
VLYISVHRCHCRLVCVTFCALVSVLILDVDVFKEGLLIFHRYSKLGYYDQGIVKDM